MGLLAAGGAFLSGILTQNESVKKFSNDFIDEVVAWVRPWFIQDDAVAKVVMNADGEAAAKKAIIEAKLPKLLEDEQFKKELEAYMEKAKTETVRRKNVLEGSEVEAEGDVSIGDEGGQDDGSYDEKNIVSNSKIKTKGRFSLGDKK